MDSTLVKYKGQQNAPQETEIESYVVGGIKQDIKGNLPGFSNPRPEEEIAAQLHMLRTLNG